VLRAPVRPGGSVAILAFGTLLHPALAGGRQAGRHGGQHALRQAAGRGAGAGTGAHPRRLVTVEEGCHAGGAGSAVGECLAAAGVSVPLLHLGLPDRFIEHGDPAKLLAMCGLDAAGIEQSIRQRLPAAGAAAVNG
jgi:1-deoxy-D-xylulose-5-phosphate synthase